MGAKINKEVGEKTGLQAAAMISFTIGTTFISSSGEDVVNKIIGLLMIFLGAGIMLYKYKRELDRGVQQ